MRRKPGDPSEDEVRGNTCPDCGGGELVPEQLPRRYEANTGCPVRCVECGWSEERESRALTPCRGTSRPGTTRFEAIEGIDLTPLVPTSVTRLGSKNKKPVYLIRDQAGQRYVVKVFSKGSLRSPTGRTAYERELACYRTLPSTLGEYGRISRLFGWGPRHLVLEYLERSMPVYEFIRAGNPDAFIAAVAALHWETAATRLPVHLELAHRATYSPGWDACRNALDIVRRRLGPAVSAKCLRVLSQCRKRQPRLGPVFHAHNDLIGSNVRPGADGRYHFIDFASRTAEARWILDDVVRFGFMSRDMELARTLVGMYASVLRERGISRLDVPSQVRFSLLRLSMSMLRWSAEFQKVGAGLILNVLLDEKSFDSWLDSWDSPFSAAY
jgi:hypothetical protein